MELTKKLAILADAAKSAEEILAEPAGDSADSRALAGSAGASRRNDEKKRGEICGEG
jgi:hypothetical protein